MKIKHSVLAIGLCLAFNVSAQESPIQTMRNFFWVATGFPTQASYVDFHENDPVVMELAPIDGLIGRINSLATTISRAISARGIASCESVPLTGSFSSGGATYTYNTATHTPPSDYDETSTYTKRVDYSTADMDAVFEFHCGTESMFAKTTSNGQVTAIYYNNATSEKFLDFYIHDEGNFSTTPGNFQLALAVRIDTSTKKVRSYLTRTGMDDDGVNEEYTGYRFSTHTNYETQETSIHYDDVSGSPIDVYTNDTGVVSVQAPNSGVGTKKQGCAADFSVQTSTIASATLCAGLDLTVAPTPPFAGGSFSMEWLFDNLKTSLTGL